MKLLKTAVDIIIVFFIGLGIYFKVSDKTTAGYYLDDTGWQYSVFSWRHLFFFALVFIAIRFWILYKSKSH